MNAGTGILPDGSVRIVIPLEPKTKKNSQRILYKNNPHGGNKIPFVSPSSSYKEYEKECGVFLRDLEIDYPVNVEAHFYMKTRRRVDLTNLNESLHDALVKHHVLTDDNCTVIVSTDGSAVFYDRDDPRTEVLITRREGTFGVKAYRRKISWRKKRR